MCVSIERYDERFRACSDITAKPRSYVSELDFVRREVVPVIALQGLQALIEPVVPSTVP
jgi:hypothetical protein